MSCIVSAPLQIPFTQSRCAAQTSKHLHSEGSCCCELVSDVKNLIKVFQNLNKAFNIIITFGQEHSIIKSNIEARKAIPFANKTFTSLHASLLDEVYARFIGCRKIIHAKVYS